MCTVEAYSRVKGLPESFLRGLGLDDFHLNGTPAVRIPYLDEARTEVATRFRLTVTKPVEGDATGGNRFRWRSGTKPVLYGLWRLAEARRSGYVVVVEGESDAHTLWHHGVPAVGVPGASAWSEDWARYLDGISTIYVLIEPDRGGEATRRWLSRSGIRDRARLVSLAGAKDPSELHVADPAAFPARWRDALESAVPWKDAEAREAADLKEAAWSRCADLARSPRILDRFAALLPGAGLVGELGAARLLYLCVTSRLLDRPVSAVVKGPSSAGKSHLTRSVLRFFPTSAWYGLTAMSERALAYSSEPLKHRVLVLGEATAMEGEIMSYLIRSLLTDGAVRYEFVDKTPQGLQARTVVREGPTGLLITTTANRLHPEVETRLFSVPVSDSQEQTRLVLEALASEREDQLPDLDAWLALQDWLARAEHRVTVPYARALADRIEPVAVRLRRDFGAMLALIRTHAILHQSSRQRDEHGRIVASLDDYAAVRDLVASLISEGVESSVPPPLRQTVEAVVALDPEGMGVTAAQVGKQLNLDKSSASRRLRDAADRGYMNNAEQRRGRPGRWIIGDPIPAEQPMFPEPDSLGCAVAPDLEQDRPPLQASPEAAPLADFMHTVAGQP
jgi:hypothetical protein